MRKFKYLLLLPPFCILIIKYSKTKNKILRCFLYISCFEEKNITKTINFENG